MIDDNKVVRIGTDLIFFDRNLWEEFRNHMRTRILKGVYNLGAVDPRKRGIPYSEFFKYVGSLSLKNIDNDGEFTERELLRWLKEMKRTSRSEEYIRGCFRFHDKISKTICSWTKWTGGVKIIEQVIKKRRGKKRKEERGKIYTTNIFRAYFYGPGKLYEFFTDEYKTLFLALEKLQHDKEIEQVSHTLYSIKPLIKKEIEKGICKIMTRFKYPSYDDSEIDQMVAFWEELKEKGSTEPDINDSRLSIAGSDWEIKEIILKFIPVSSKLAKSIVKMQKSINLSEFKRKVTKQLNFEIKQYNIKFKRTYLLEKEVIKYLSKEIVSYNKFLKIYNPS